MSREKLTWGYRLGGFFLRGILAQGDITQGDINRWIFTGGINQGGLGRIPHTHIYIYKVAHVNLFISQHFLFAIVTCTSDDALHK